MHPVHMSAPFSSLGGETMPAPVVYYVDAHDRIFYVNKGWRESARAYAPEPAALEAASGHSLWHFIADTAIRTLYQACMQHVRAGNTLLIPLRCDTPTHQRLFTLQMIPEGDGTIAFISGAAAIAAHPRFALLDIAHPRTSEDVRICSWCKRVDIGRGRWAEVDVAMSHFRLFDMMPLPRLSHVACGDCEQMLDLQSHGYRVALARRRAFDSAP